jgi:hypothetical protein
LDKFKASQNQQRKQTFNNKSESKKRTHALKRANNLANFLLDTLEEDDEDTIDLNFINSLKMKEQEIKGLDLKEPVNLEEDVFEIDTEIEQDYLNPFGIQGDMEYMGEDGDEFDIHNF